MPYIPRDSTDYQVHYMRNLVAGPRTFKSEFSKTEENLALHIPLGIRICLMRHFSSSTSEPSRAVTTHWHHSGPIAIPYCAHKTETSPLSYGRGPYHPRLLYESASGPAQEGGSQWTVHAKNSQGVTMAPFA